MSRSCSSTSLAESRPECPVDRLALELATASVEHLAGEQTPSRAAAERAAQLAQAAGAQAAVAEAHLHLARSFRYQDDRRAVDELDAAQRAYELVGDRAGTARVLIEHAAQAQHTEGCQP